MTEHLRPIAVWRPLRDEDEEKIGHLEHHEPEIPKGFLERWLTEMAETAHTEFDEELEHLIKEQRRLSRRVAQLEAELTPKPLKTHGEEVYEKLRIELGAELSGKIIAIDTEERKVVGKGDTLIEAYNDARSKSDKKQFYFRRVGKSYLFKV